jgi:hypothetical protein
MYLNVENVDSCKIILVVVSPLFESLILNLKSVKYLKMVKQKPRSRSQLISFGWLILHLKKYKIL